MVTLLAFYRHLGFTFLGTLLIDVPRGEEKVYVHAMALDKKGQKRTPKFPHSSAAACICSSGEWLHGESGRETGESPPCSLGCALIKR